MNILTRLFFSYLLYFSTIGMENLSKNSFCMPYGHRGTPLFPLASAKVEPFFIMAKSFNRKILEKCRKEDAEKLVRACLARP